MKVEKISEMEYTILGDKSATYTVNLLDNNRKGSCNCSDFKFRVAPKWRRHDEAAPCKHILLVLGGLMWERINNQ